MARQQARSALPDEKREALRSMKWEARLEDARRRRAAVLAARAGAASRDATVDPAPETERHRSDPALVLTSGMRVRDGPIRALSRVVGEGTERLASYSAALAVRSRAFRSGPKGEDAPGGVAPEPSSAEDVGRVVRFRSVRTGHLALALLGAIGAALFYVLLARDAPPTVLQTLSVTVLDPPADGGTAPAGRPAPSDAVAFDALIDAVKPGGMEIDDPWLTTPNPAAPEPVLALSLGKPPAPVMAELADAPGVVNVSAAPARLAPPKALTGPDDGVARKRVRVFLARGAEDGRLAETVAAQALVVDAVSEVGFRISATHVRYYHAADRQAAERLADLAGGAARDFTGAARLPEEGYLELYVSAAGLPDRR